MSSADATYGICFLKEGLFSFHLCAWGRVWGYDHDGMCSRPVLDWLGQVLPPAGKHEALQLGISSLDQSCVKAFSKEFCLIKFNQSQSVAILRWSVFFSSVHRRARTTSQRHKCVSPSRHPTSSTIIFIIIKRTNAETITIILPWQKKKEIKKKSIPSRKSSSFLRDKSFMTIYCKCHVINVMCCM